MSVTSEIIGVLYQDTMILCIYQHPSATDLTLIDSLTRFWSANSCYSLIIVGDFNVHECECLGCSFTSSTGATLHGFCELFGLS